MANVLDSTSFEWTAHDSLVLSRIVERMSDLAHENLRPTHVLMHPEELSEKPERLFGLQVVRHPWVERGHVYLTVQA